MYFKYWIFNGTFAHQFCLINSFQAIGHQYAPPLIAVVHVRWEWVQSKLNRDLFSSTVMNAVPALPNKMI